MSLYVVELRLDGYRFVRVQAKDKEEAMDIAVRDTNNFDMGDWVVNDISITGAEIEEESDNGM